MDEEAIKKATGEAIKAARQRGKMSQSDLALRAGTSQSRVSYWEAGKETPSVSNLMATASALGVTAGDLLPSPDDINSARRLLRGEEE